MAASAVAQFRDILEGLVSTEAKLAATAVLVAAAVVTVLLLAPRIVRAIHSGTRDRILNNDRVPVEISEFDWRLPTTAIVRTLQFIVVLIVGLGILVVWGFVDLAAETVAIVAGTIPILLRLLFTVGVVAATLIGIDLLEGKLDEYAEESDALNQHQQGIVFRVLQVSVLIAAAIASLSVWGINLGGLLVGAGFLGIVIGTAARTTIGSLIAGFVLMFSRPFEIGDWVEIDDDEGIVTDITIINTRIRNPAGEMVILPNERVANATITNRTTHGRLRLSVDVGVDYDADIAAAEAVVQETLEEDISGILANPTPQVIPKSLGDSAVVLECRFWIDHPSAAKRAMATARVVRSVKASLDDAGIKIPYPQRELLGREETNGFRVAREAGLSEQDVAAMSEDD